MNPLEPPDSLHVDAAQGWLGLGNHLEASAELEKISPGMQGHPDVLNVRWGICAATRQWEAALEIASAIIRLTPEDPVGWVHRSFALHELKRTAEARDNLLRIVDKHRDSPTIRYNLACYECQLGRLDLAKKWLQAAFRLGDAKKILLAAREDPDLKPLWKDLQQWNV